MEFEREIQLVQRSAGGTVPPLFTPAAAEEVRAFHRTLPGYAPTPLAELRRLAEHLGPVSYTHLTLPTICSV